MARPRTYQDDRIDTKVRLRPDHHAKLEAMASEDPSVSRNKIIEQALDLLFARPKPHPTIVTSPAPDQKFGKADKPEAARVEPRVSNPSRVMADRPEPGPKMTRIEPKTAHRPRRPI